MSEPWKLYLRERFSSSGIVGVFQSDIAVTVTSQIVGFDSRAQADFAFDELTDAGVFVVKLYA